MNNPAAIGSFRGVTFHTTEAALGVGRRNVLNEYPSRDTPYVDDLGRRARRYEVEGYLLGANYLEQRDALIKAFEEGGPGELVHPRYGVVWVSLANESVRFKESYRELRKAAFTAVFVEDSDNYQPSGERDTVAELERAADASDTAAGLAFADALNLTGPQMLTDLVAQATALDIGALTDAAKLYVDSSALGGIMDAASGALGQVATLLANPLAMVADLRGLYDRFAVGIRIGSAPAGALNAMRQMNLAARANLPALNAARVAAAASPLMPATPSRTLLNEAARAELTRRLVISTQARVLAVAITDDVVATAQQATAWRDEVLEQIDTELEVADPDVGTARAMSALRAAVVRDVGARAELLKQRSTFTPLAVLPSLVLAHRIYGDASRADELVARNGVRHPAFMPVKALEILL